MKISFKKGSLLIAAGALLWATDALFRVDALTKLNATRLVWIEHLIALLILTPYVLLREESRRVLFKLKPMQWIAAIGVGAGASAIALIWFTESFRYLNPSVAILLQKLQPIIASLLAIIFLGEQPSKKMKIAGPVALAAGLWLSFPDFNFAFLWDPKNLHAHGIFLASGAAFFWAAGTVLGRTLLKGVPASVGTFWRFFFGLLTLTLLEPQAYELFLDPSLNPQTWLAIFYISVFSGLLAMLLYYKGLAQTPAHQATFVELIFPVGAIVLNTIFLGLGLSGVEFLAGSILLLSIAWISR